MLLCFVLATAPLSFARDPSSKPAVIIMKAVMPPSASLSIKTVAARPDVGRASAQISISSAKASPSAPELNCTVHPLSSAKTSGACNIHSSVSWGMATFTLEAF
jgi:hypothetical protein